MTRYNTGNPLGSTDPRDLYDNAENLDSAINGDSATWVDRLGKTRTSIDGAVDAMDAQIVASQSALNAKLSDLQQQADQTVLEVKSESDLVLSNLGFLPPVTYAAGLSVTSSRYTVTYQGTTYSANADSVPFTTTETFDPTKWRVVQGITAERFVDQAGKRLDQFRGTNLGESHRAAPMCISLSRNSTVPMQNDTAADPVAWGNRLVETGVHWATANPTRITIPRGASGIWQFRASLEFPVNATGTREVIIRKGGPTGTVVARQCVNATPARTQVLMVISEPLVCLAGEYFEVYYYQNSGGVLQGPTSQARFSGERVGDLRGRWDAVTFSADYSYRGDWSKYTATGGTIIEPSGLSVVADPVYPTLLAGRIRATKSNDSVLYPRVQAQTSSFITRTDDAWIALSIFVPADTHARLLEVGHGINIHEVYGPPFGTRSPNLVQYNPASDVGLNVNTLVNGDDYRIWTLPPTECVGKWIDIIHRVRLSTDAAVGFHEVYMDNGDGNGMRIQTLKDGSTRYYLATVLPGVNDGGNNFSSLKVSWDGTSALEEATIYVGEHRVGIGSGAAAGATDRSGYTAAY